MPRLSQLPPPASPLSGLELTPLLQGGGADGNVGLPILAYGNLPRGNVLAAAYTVGYRVEGYNFPNELRERFAHYAQHGLSLGALVCKDKVTFNVQLHAKAELLHPTRRYMLSASPGVEIQLGDHIDLSFDGSLTRRELPEFLIPDDDPEAIGRADYAEPTSMYGSVSVRFHWDATNGARNNRFNNL